MVSTTYRKYITGVLVSCLLFNTSQPVIAFNQGMRLLATEECLFSKQLHTSPEVRREYMNKVVEAVQRTGEGEMVEEEDPSFWSVIVGIGGTKSLDINSDLDSLSRDCITCHDGGQALAVGVVLRNDPYRRGRMVDSFTSDHPVGMHYSTYVAVKRGYKPIVSDKMLLIDGKVGCLTCHDPWNPEKGHLAVSDYRSGLCQSCHNT